VFSIVITEKGGAQRQLDFEGAEIGIGRLEDNDLCLPKNNVSKYHARLVFKDERYVILDQKSTNGTYVNGRRISAPMVVRKGDKIYIGDFILTLAARSGIEAMAAREFRPLPVMPDARGATVPTSLQDPTISDRPVDPRTVVPRINSLPPAAPASALRTQPPNRASAPPPLPDKAPAARQSVPPPLPPRTAPTATQPESAPPNAAEPISIDQHAATQVSDDASHSAAQAAWSSEHAHAVENGQTSPTVLAPLIRLQGALAMLMERLATHMNVARGEEGAFPSEHQTTLEQLMDELTDEGAIGPDLDRRFLREAAMSEAVGLGPLDRLLANRSVREIVVDGPTRVLADLGGGLTPVSSFFSDDSAVLVTARRLLHRAGQKLDMSETVHEAQLPAGGWVQLLLPPLAPKGPLISVRCPLRAQSSPESLVTDGTLSTDMLLLLRNSVQQRKNVLVLGPTGAGVSSLLAMITTFAADHERVVTIENSPSASLLNSQALPLSRRAMPEVTLAEFLRQASLLRYDRLLIDDVQAEDTLSALTAAAATSGVLLGMHAPNPQIALTLLEVFAQSALPSAGRGVKPLLAAALHVLVHLAPDRVGTRRVLSISELRYSQPDTLELRPLFRYDGKAFLAVEPRASFPSA
jgi:pilus assembly protein CpaF